MLLHEAIATCAALYRYRERDTSSYLVSSDFEADVATWRYLLARHGRFIRLASIAVA